jgi:hypothetical protein
MMTSNSGSSSGAVLALSGLEDEGTTILRDIPEDEFPAAPLREPQIAQKIMLLVLRVV